MPKSNKTAAEIADVCARLIKQESKTSIQKLTGISQATITRIVTALQRHGLALEVRTKVLFDNAREAKLHEIFRTTTQSNREIVRRTGIRLDTVNRSRIRFNAALIQAGGELPKCGCGQYLHHPRVCVVRHHQQMTKHGVASVHTLPPDMREDVHRRLLLGESLRSIGERIGFRKVQVTSYLRSLSPAERQQREGVLRTNAGRRRAALVGKKIVRPHATNPLHDPLYARLSEAVPRGIDPALRDDMISEAYLEVLDGRLTDQNLVEGVKKVRGKVFKAFANPWGNRSIDAPTSDGGTGTLLEAIPDERALLAFEAIA